MDHKKNKKSVIRELAEEASQNGKKQNNKNYYLEDSDKSDNIKDLMKELNDDKNMTIINHNTDTDDVVEDDNIEDTYEDDSGDNSDNSDNYDEKGKKSVFEENVKKYLKLDNSIRITMEQLKDLKEKRKPYEEYI